MGCPEILLIFLFSLLIPLAPRPPIFTPSRLYDLMISRARLAFGG